VGQNGSGVLKVGTDAFFSMDGILMQSSSNSVSGVVEGVTFDIHDAAPDTPVTVEIERDMDAIEEKVTELLTSYNSLLAYVRNQTRYGDPEDEESKSGTLVGDMTITSVVSQIKNIFQHRFDSINEAYTSAAMLGIETNSDNGKLELDSEKFQEALSTSFDEVVKFFSKTGFSDNADITFGRSTSNTQSGVYYLEEVDATHLRIRREGESTWYTSNARSGGIVTFSDGPAEGLSLTAPEGSIGAGNTATFTFSKGLATSVDELVGSMTDSSSGVVALRQESWQRSIRSADDRIERLETRIENYRLRLVKQFSAMEQTLNQLQSQSSNMMSALGY
jgi:flagellar hook-associated protein 2